MAVEKTRLHIPLLFGYDVIHGHRTIFPIPLAEAGSWDLAAIETSASTAAREASADGLHWTFAPMVDISRDPRWGRIMEGAGEDTWWGSKVAAARVRGFQGKDSRALDHVMACVKHFAAYGAPIAGREYNVVDMSPRDLNEVYLPPYKAAVDAGVDTVMTSFNEINGVPSTGNDWLLKDLLRKQWGFKGFVVTDYTSINEMIKHGVVGDEAAAGALALKSGVDMDMQGGIFQHQLPSLLKEGKINKVELDAAVRRVLEAKYRLGLFEDPYRFSNDQRAEKEEMKKENLEAARDVARKSVVLLKNEGSVLPLKREGTIALIGPLADDQRDMIGAWSGAGDWKKSVTLRAGLQAAIGDKAKLLYALGANILEDDAMIEYLNKHDGKITKDKRSAEELLKEAVKTAKKADVVVLALGEAFGMSGEAASRTQIRIPSNQEDLLRALKETGKPIVLVLFNGRPLALEFENKNASAILEAWFLGTEAGSALADVIFGDYNPSAKLTITFPRSEGQIPIFYAERSTGRPFSATEKYTSKYIDSPNTPLFPFGYGLSYTKFDYSDVKLNTKQLKKNGKIQASVTVKNSGERDGDEVVQLYIHDVVASVTRPVKQLRGYQKVSLKKGESKTVSFDLTPEDLKFYNRQLKYVNEPGEFKVFIGTNSQDVKEASFILK
jgi:beta-glucosidase